MLCIITASVVVIVGRFTIIDPKGYELLKEILFVVGGITGSYTAFRIGSAAMRKPIHETLVSEAPARELVQENFEVRSRHHEASYKTMLMLIIATLLLGVILYSYTDILLRDTSTIEQLRYLSQQINKYNSALTEAEANSSKFLNESSSRSLILIEAIKAEKNVPNELKYELDSLLDRVQKYVGDIENGHYVSADSKLAKVDSSIVEHLDSVISKIHESQSRAEQPLRAESLVSISARLGTIVILIFMVQVLTNLYRYHARLSTFYHGRAKALQLISPTRELTLYDALKLTAAEHLDFGKSEKPPSQQALDLAKSIIDKFGDKTK